MCVCVKATSNSNGLGEGSCFKKIEMILVYLDRHHLSLFLKWGRGGGGGGEE